MKRALAAAAFVASLSSSVFARAEEAPRNVEVTVRGGGAEDALLEATIKELLERVRLSSHHAPAAAYVSLLSRVTVDLSKPGVANVSVVDARDGRVLMNRDVTRDPNPSVAREEIAHAVQTAVEADLLERESPASPAVNVPVPVPVNVDPVNDPKPPAIAKEHPPENPQDKPASPTGPSSLTLDVATFASAGPVAKSSGVSPRVGGGAIVALASSSLRPSLGLYGSYAPPFETGSDVIRARASFVALRAVPAIEILRTSSIALDWGVGGGVDILTVTPQSDVLPTSRLGPSSSNADILVTSLLTLRADIVTSVYFFASAGIEIDAFTPPVRRAPRNRERRRLRAVAGQADGRARLRLHRRGSSMRRALLLAGFAMFAACKDDPVVLVTLAPPDGHPADEVRCTSDECAAGSFCERPTCDAPAGSCRSFPTVCPPDEEPICGCDGVTYFNDCLRRAAGIGAAHPGECDRDAKNCRDASECPDGASCSLLSGNDARDCDREIRGRCWVLPVACPPPGPDRWKLCAPPDAPAPGPCVDTCSAIRTGLPHHRELRCE